jgi:hypothetical protein
VSPRDRDRLAAPVVALYWALLAAGLVLYGVVVSTDQIIPLALGSLLGSALGTSVALRDVRAWFVLVVLLTVAYVGVPLGPEGASADHFWMAFVPAVLCSYASLAERWSLAALWFPTVVWMLTILDRTRGARTLDTFGVLLFALLAIAGLVFLRARETRRAGIWKRVAPTPIAEPRAARVEREKPMRPLVRTAWSIAMTAAVFGFAAFVAPRMWRVEKTQHHVPHDGVALGIPCCPGDDTYERSRVREYLDLGRGHDSGVDTWNECMACPSVASVAQFVYEGSSYAVHASYDSDPVGVSGDVPVVSSHWDGQPTTFAEIAPPGEHYPVEQDNAIHDAPAPRYASQVTPRPVPAPIAPAQPPSPVPPSSMHPPAPPAPPAPHAPAMVGAHTAAMPSHPAGDDSIGWLRWLVLVTGGALAGQLLLLALRPIRRAVTLRHFRRPYWDETVDQRVSNSWQLALVGLRDAGWRAGEAEQPQELARRVDLPELERCATILERARYGVGLADDDLDGMRDAADAVYRDARRQVGPLARVLSWLRWPLV